MDILNIKACPNAMHILEKNIVVSKGGSMDVFFIRLCVHSYYSTTLTYHSFQLMILFPINKNKNCLVIYKKHTGFLSTLNLL